MVKPSLVQSRFKTGAGLSLLGVPFYSNIGWELGLSNYLVYLIFRQLEIREP